MAVQQQDIDRAPVVPNAQIIGFHFVNQYYSVLVVSPQSLFKFYDQDRSTLSRPIVNGQIFSLTAAIQQQITSADRDRFKMDIKRVDSQASHNNGVLVLVSGSITFTNNATRSFTQAFFLARQENGYLVLNDTFRYVDEEPHQPEHNFSQTNGYPIEQYSAQANPVSEPVSKSEIESQEVQIDVVEQPTTMAAEVHIPRTEVATRSAGQFQKVSAVEQPPNQGQPAATQETPAVFQDAPQKSQGLNVKENAATETVGLPSTIRAVKDKNTAEESGCSIFISNLPSRITRPQVEKEFRKFGAVKPSRVEVRRCREGKASYAFVEFVEAASVQAAIQASKSRHIRMGARKVAVRAKLPIADGEGFRKDGPNTIAMQSRIWRNNVNNRGRGS